MNEQMVIGCAWCDWTELADKHDRGTMKALLREHVETCPTHPMRALEEKYREVERELSSLRALYEEGDDREQKGLPPYE